MTTAPTSLAGSKPAPGEPLSTLFAAAPGRSLVPPNRRAQLDLDDCHRISSQHTSPKRKRGVIRRPIQLRVAPPIRRNESHAEARRRGEDGERKPRMKHG